MSITACRLQYRYFRFNLTHNLRVLRMDDHKIAVLRARIKNAMIDSNSLNKCDDWWLLGTSGCHLCLDAEQLMQQFQAVQPILYTKVDIADFDEALMMEFATTIPVLLTMDKRLNYPFSIVELQQLVNS